MHFKQHKVNYVCSVCNNTHKTLTSAKHHFVRTHFEPDGETCGVCKTSNLNKYQHSAKKHIQLNIKCQFCPKSFASFSDINEHYGQQHQIPPSSPFKIGQSAFNRRVLLLQKEFKYLQIKNLETLKVDSERDIKELITHQLNIKKMLRYAIVVQAEYLKYDELGGVDDTLTIYLRSNSKTCLLTDKSSIHRQINQSFEELNERHEGFIASGSNWVLNQCNLLNIELGKLTFIGGCNDKTVINSKLKKYVIDVESINQECFFNAVAVAYFSKHTINTSTPAQLGVLARAYTKQHFKTKGLKMPINANDVKKFERKNRHLNIQINVFTYSDEHLIPVHTSTIKNPKKIVNLYLKQIRTNTFKHHYTTISNLNGFVRIFNYEKHTHYHCSLCLNSFWSEEALENHFVGCSKEDPVLIEYPKPDDTLEFRAYEKQIAQPMVGFADFEASLVPISRKDNADRYNCDNCKNEGDIALCTHSTSEVHHQIATSYSITIIDEKGVMMYEKTESDLNNVIEKFFKTLKYIENTYIPLLQRYRVKYDYTNEEIEQHANAELCYLCKGAYSNVRGMHKVRDHCHYSNKFLGSAHSKCNWKRTVNTNIPVFIHNFRNYDGQFIAQGLKFNKEDVSGLPYNMEKFRTLQVGKIVFVDSLHLLPSSLDKLVSDLTASNHPFPLLDQHPFFAKFPHLKHLLIRKGVYPYEWASSVNKLINQKTFPPISCFYSTLSKSIISQEDYLHGMKVFEAFQCANMLDYCHLYCRLDTILLAEAVLDFRKMVLKEFALDCTRYISTPQLAFDCLLTTFKEPVQMMHDPEMIMMVTQNIKGGVSFVNERHVDLKDYMKTSNNENVEDKIQDQLLYIDANNLYSVAQRLPMPFSSYEWMEKEELNDFCTNLLQISENAETGYIVEVDLEYPQHLFEQHKALPLLPYHRTMTFNDVSPFSKDSLLTLRKRSEALRYKSTKLVTDMTDKDKYVVHYRNLQTYVKLGIKIKKIWRGFKFKQKRYLKPFIDLCTQKRIAAETVNQKNHFKLFMNSSFGKHLQDNRKHMISKIVQKYPKFAKHYNSPLYKGHRILSENVIAVYLRPGKVALNRLYAVGFTILELSKNHMYTSYYDFIQPVLGKQNVSVVLTDTDSLVLHTKNFSRNQVLDRLTPCLDFSNYPKDHPRFSTQNKAKPGYFKDESASNFMTEIIGLKSKCYITKVQNMTSNTQSENVVCKGVTKAARQTLNMQIFRNVVNSFSKVHAEQYCIRSRNHHLFTQRIKKIALSSTDDKRYLLSCGRHSAPYKRQNIFTCDECEQ